MPSIGALILAAGQSQRMGPPNKLLLRIGDHPMIRHVVQTYRAALDGPITVVTGHEAQQVEAALTGLDVRCVFNPDYAKGQQGSVAVGLRHAPEVDLLLIGLGDQPLLAPSDIRALVDAHTHGDPAKISIPAIGEVRGNPIAIPTTLRPRLTADPQRPGCMRFTRDNPDLVQRHSLLAPGFYADVDTPKDYAALAQTETS
ncbi:nucleotidyltransferase family protein [uncultured Tateyamaria sp.]|uniref:nucleotidyltransferase family protein n=1 Tax=uncultured Tateyamaria sp. TaxID=455651 RepID=UPI002618C4E4|nr:nucleotidyltransferase family protein [uncultured Tateyamaria sp.]